MSRSYAPRSYAVASICCRSICASGSSPRSGRGISGSGLVIGIGQTVPRRRLVAVARDTCTRYSCGGRCSRMKIRVPARTGNLVRRAEDFDHRHHGAIFAVNHFNPRFMDLIVNECRDLHRLDHPGPGGCWPRRLASPSFRFICREANIGNDHIEGRVVLIGNVNALLNWAKYFGRSCRLSSARISEINSC